MNAGSPPKIDCAVLCCYRLFYHAFDARFRWFRKYVDQRFECTQLHGFGGLLYEQVGPFWMYFCAGMWVFMGFILFAVLGRNSVETPTAEERKKA